MKMQSRKIWYYRITLIILLFAVLLAWALLPGVHEFINRSVAAFAAVDQQGIERFIQSYGALAAVVSFLLMILQAIAAPLPAFLITFANASLLPRMPHHAARLHFRGTADTLPLHQRKA